MAYIYQSLFLSALLVLFTSLPVGAQENIRLLENGKPIEREMAGGETHVYKIQLSAGQFLHLITEQKEIDVVLTLFSQDGNKVLEIDGPTGNRGVESLWFIGETAGDYKLEISSFEKNVPAGKYEISVKEMRAGITDDKFYIKGQKLRAEAFLLRTEQKEESTKKAFEKYEEAASLFRQIEDKRRKAPLLRQIGKIYQSLGKNKEAIGYFKEAQDLFDEIGQRSDVADTFLDVGVSYSNLFMDAEAFDSLKKGLAIAQASGNKKLEVDILNQIGLIYNSLGDYPQSLQNFLQALKISEEINNKEQITTLLKNAGNVYWAQGNYARALEFHQKQLSLLEKWEFKTQIPATLLNIGNVYTNQGNYQQALEYYQRALTGFEKLRIIGGFAFAVSNIGSVYLYSGEYDKALEYFLRSRDLKAKFMAKDPLSLSNIGSVYAKQGKYPEALEYFQKSLEMSQSLLDNASAADSTQRIGDIYYSQGNYAKSLEYADKSAEFARQFNYQQTLWKSLFTAGKSHLALGQKKEAKQKLELAIIQIENLRTQTAGDSNEQQRFFAGKISPFEMLINLSVDEGNFSEALAYAERLKARSLLDVLQTGKADITKTMTAQERDLEQRLKMEMASLNAQISKENERQQTDKTRLTGLQNQRQKKRLEFEDFQTRLYAIHPELKIQRGEMKTISLEESGGLLPDIQSAFLEFIVGEDKSFLFVLTRDTKQSDVFLKVYPIEIKQKDLVEKIESFRVKLAKGDLEFSQQAQDLYNLLLKPAGAQLKNKNNFIIVPDSALWNLPFQALQSAQNRYLIETAAVSYAPSLTALREMTRKRKSANSSSTLLAFGNPTIGKEITERVKQVFMSEKLDSIPEAERLVNNLGKLYGANKSKVFIGAEASEDKAKTESSKYSILQFATHGILNDSSPMYSHLVLSQKISADANEDGLLEAWEMKDLELNADLVVLSACETARGRVSAGEGVIGMSWALFIAGAPTTVVSLWKVESSSTTELMLEFHHQLLSNKNISKAEALRRASLKLLKSLQYKHPSYWAPFVIVGDGF
jgi:CHAT domain-containing protein/Tfp pilus assembly protein PilF